MPKTANALADWRSCFVLLVLIVAHSGCTDAPADRIRFGLPTAPVTLDARFATDAVSTRLVRLLHRPLVDFDASAKPMADLASWEKVSPTRYRFTLRTGTTFTGGRPVTARDVVATYRSVLDPATGSPHRSSLINIADLVALDSRTIVFTLNTPDELFPGTLVIGVMSESAVASTSTRDRWSENSGAFERLDWHADGRVLLRRRDDGTLVEFVPVKDETVRAMKLIDGELDIVQGNLEPQTWRWLSGHNHLHGEQVEGTTFSYLGFNLEDPLLRERKVRLALLHAIDREAIVKHVFAYAARPAAMIFPAQHWAGAEGLAVPQYNPVRARELLTEAGFTGRLSLHYKTSTDYFRLRIATILQSQLAEIGVDLEIESLDWGTFYGDVKSGNFQVYGLSWVGLKMPDIFRYAFHSTSLPPGGANRGRYNSATADDLIEAAERAGSLTARAVLYRTLAEQLLYDLPYVPLWFEDQLVVMREDIVNYSTTADGHFDALANTSRRATLVSH
jgi:peptide/nickel transport system substrate-binding protein